ncbi:hypothetical protein AYO40_03090 [Planctomycetaceae bacterium SCGC AG-212-D15]|nr:hypothetical protein AYO40_03090 [Planctomycetaceae bacterium SCGC AG-212-D15]
MGSPVEIARYLIKLAASGETPDFLDHMRLQKLLYYVQGWHLATFGTPLFSGHIQAWTYGPVVKEVYPVFADYQRCSIPPDQEGSDPVSLSAADCAFVEGVWDAYKDHSTTKLSKMTHSEAPWREARKGLPPDARSDNEITHESMRLFFSAEMEKRQIPGLSASGAYRALEQFEKGGGRRHDEVFARLRKSDVL